jgi:hypothetical protein
VSFGGTSLRASALRAASPLPAEIEELKSAREGEAGHRAALDCEDATTAGDDPEAVAGSQHRRESAPAARLPVQDLDLSDRAVSLGQLLAAGGDDAASDDRGLEAAARDLDGPQPPSSGAYRGRSARRCRD